MVTREELQNELASLEQQKAQCQDTMTKADQVKAAAAARLTIIEGAAQMIDHLLAKANANLIAQDAAQIKEPEATSNQEQGEKP